MYYSLVRFIGNSKINFSYILNDSNEKDVQLIFTYNFRIIYD